MPAPKRPRRPGKGKKKHSSPSRTVRAQAHRTTAGSKQVRGAKGGTPPARAHRDRATAASSPQANTNVTAAEITPTSARDIPNIRSPQNARYKQWRALLTSRGIRKHGRALMAGAKVVAEVAADFGGVVEACLLNDAEDAPPPTLPATVPCYRLPRPMLRALDPGNVGGPVLVARVPDMPEWDPLAPGVADGCTLFIPFQDPVNIGATLRSATAFGVHRAVLLRESAHPFHPRSVQAGGSALYRVPIMRGPALADLHTGTLPCFSLDVSGEPLRGFRFPEHFGLVAGLEGTGMPDVAGAVQPVYIPMAPGVDSLNAATATAIALYHWRIHIADLAQTDPSAGV